MRTLEALTPTTPIVQRAGISVVSQEHKQTEIGIIPDDWKYARVDGMGEVLTGKALAAKAPGQERPYLRTKNVFDGHIDIGDVLTMPMTDVQFEHFSVQSGDVLLNEGQSLELVGRCAIYRDEYPEPCALQNQLLRFRAFPGVCADFAAHLFRHCQRTGVFARIALQTTSIAHLGGSRFAALKLPWPATESEQRIIAEALSHVDELLTALDALIAKKRAIKQAAMQQLITGRIRLPGSGGRWQTRRIGEFAAIRNQKVIPYHTAVDMPCVELEHIGHGDGRLRGYSTSKAANSPKYSFLAGDVLFGRLRPYLRKFWHAEWAGICSTEIWPLMTDPRLATSRFLRALVETDHFIESASISYGTHMPRADWQIVRNLRVRLPLLREQEDIATVFFDMDTEIAALEDRRDKTRDIKQGMMQQLLTGRIRLVNLSSEKTAA